MGIQANESVAIILARGGSKGVPLKNLSKIGGKTLLERCICAAKKSRLVGEVYVSTDDPRIASVARVHNAVVIDRPANLSGDEISSEAAWLHALKVIQKSKPLVSHLVFLQCTSPFTTGDDIDGCLSLLLSGRASCSISVVEDHSFLWRLTADDWGQGINHDERIQRLRRQDLEPTFRENGAIYCVRVVDFLSVGRRFCGPVALYLVRHPALEIDTPLDLKICNAIVGEAIFDVPDVERLRRIKVVVTDFDGIHTNDSALLAEDGLESVVVSRKDGLGVEILRQELAMKVVILSKERNLVVSERAKKLKVEAIQACDDKVVGLSGWLRGHGYSWADILYVGNDINDIGPLSLAGLSACPADAHSSAMDVSDWVIPVRGGEGVLRFIADRLLSAMVVNTDGEDRSS